MPIILLELPQAILDRIQAYVQTGKYTDRQSFIAIATENQIYLEGVHAAGKHQNDSTPVTTVQKNPPPKRFEPGPVNNLPPPMVLDQMPISEKVPRMARISEVLIGRVVNPPRDGRFHLPVLWGQYNRLLPGMVALRSFASLLYDTKSTWIPLSDLHRVAGDVAIQVGEQLKHHDQANNSRRGEKLATAFPVGGRDLVKAMLRHQTQFVGTISKTGKLGGLLPELRFVDIRDDHGRPEVAMTEAGLRFGGIATPALDEPEGATVATAALQEFYLEHVAMHIPLEFIAMTALATAIESGNVSPPQLDSATEAFLEAHGLRKDLASTQRGGLVGRMSELDFITFERVGLNVRYSVTSTGHNMLVERSIESYQGV